MDTIDFQRMLINLLVIYSNEELLKLLALDKVDVENLNRTFKVMQDILNLHYRKLPELHTQEILFVKS